MSGKLEQYGKSDYPPLEKKDIPKLVTPKKDYEAFVKSKGAERVQSFRIYDKEGNFNFHHYGHLIEGSYREGSLILTTTSRIYTLTGRHLDKLAELFSDKQIKAVYEFNPDKHALSQEKKAILIEKIEEED